MDRDNQMLMYKRKEEIEEEDLDWDSQPKDSAKVEEKNVISKNDNKSLHQGTEPVYSSNVKKGVSAYFNGNEYLLLGLSILIVPYLVGFLFNTILFFIYGGMSLATVLGIVIKYKALELWSIGAYAFITIGIIWILLQAYNDRRG